MAERVSIFVEGAPGAFGHFSQAIKYGNAVHVSGQLPVDPKTNKLVSTEVDAQARAVFQYLTAVMQSCAGQLSNILSMRLYMVDMRDHKVVDTVSKEFFFFTPPARTIIPVPSLPFGARIMIDAIAELNPVDLKAKPLL